MRIDDKGQHAWEADVTLVSGDKASTRDGWIAVDVEGGGKHYANRDVRDENKAVAKNSLDADRKH